MMMTLTTLKYHPTRRVEEEMKVAQKWEIQRADKKILTQRAPLYQTSAEDKQIPVIRVLILFVLIGKNVKPPRGTL